ncbi:MAG: hypothetical protein IPH20_15470 [Bacteroidales bacterium]|nr:hypothetical protein [Bacteroidales bacterium]
MFGKITVKSVVLTLSLIAGLHLSAQNIHIKALSDTADVVNYELHLTVTNLSQQSISGMAGIRFTTPLNNLTQLPLELKQLQVDSVKSADDNFLNLPIPVSDC